jgi:hypothetical protein
VLLEFYRYPAEPWIHLRPTNPIECTFATVRLPTKISKGPGSHAAGLATACSRCLRWRDAGEEVTIPGPKTTETPQWASRREQPKWLSVGLMAWSGCRESNSHDRLP